MGTLYHWSKFRGAAHFTFSADREHRENYTIIPNLLTHTGSVLSLSVGPRVVRETLSFRRDVLGQKVFVFDPYGVTDQHSASINLLDTLDSDLPGFRSDAHNMAESLVQPFKDSAHLEQKRFNQMHPTVLSNEPTLRPDLAANLLAAMFIYLKTADESDVPSENRNLAYCAKMLSSGKEEWNTLMLDMQHYDKPWGNTVNRAGRDFFVCDDNQFFIKAKDVASNAVSFALDHEFANKIDGSSLDFYDLRDEKTSIYVVMPEHAVDIAAPWLRLMINRAKNVLPNVIDADDRHLELRQQDRILFMLDDFHKLGRLSGFQGGLCPSVLFQGITYWGLAPFEGPILDAYKGNFVGSHNNACVQHLDKKHGSGDCGQNMLALVQQQIIASPPRPVSGACTTPYSRPVPRG